MALVNGRSKRLSGPMAPSSEEGFQFRMKEFRSHKGHGLMNKEGVVKLLLVSWQINCNNGKRSGWNIIGHV